MPELPEVETIRHDLAERVTGRCFTGVELLWPGSIDRPSPEEFARDLPGKCIAAVERRGKYLIFRLDARRGDRSGQKRSPYPSSLPEGTGSPHPNPLPEGEGIVAQENAGGYLAVHLRMTGRLRWVPPGSDRHQHLRAVLSLDDGHELQFEDQRKFGRLYLVPDDAALAQVLAKVGPEPLEGVSREGFHDLLSRRRAQLKPLLLDQRFLAGLGNIYVDEALHRAKLHPLRRSDTLSPAEVDRLYDGIVAALRQGIDNRGTTLAAYRDAWGTAGRNQERLLVFRQEGQPCPTCGTLIAKTRVAGRGTHYCPTCQPEP